MKNRTLLLTFIVGFILINTNIANAQNTIENYIKEYPNQQQTKMMNKWLETNEKGSFWFSGLTQPGDDIVISPQANVDYGYSWISVSDGPAIFTVPKYDKFYSVAVFDMKHNVPLVIRAPEKPILIIRPGQKAPEGDFIVVNLETDQGLIFTRYVIADNLEEVKKLRKQFKLEGGKGDMVRNVQKFSPEIEEKALTVLNTLTTVVSPDDMFGNKSGDAGVLSLAAGVRIGQLGTPAGTVRYNVAQKDAKGEFLDGNSTYIVTTPANMFEEGGYFSVTAYSMDKKLLIPNKKKIYARSNFDTKPNKDGTYTLTLSPDGEGKNGIPTTGIPFYIIVRAYVPTPGLDLFETKIEKQ
jgi:hypothetical protein